MKIAAQLTGLHPQTLRKYERIGLLTPARNQTSRLYSDEDITRLRIIKQLVEDEGLNLSGVRKSLEIRRIVLEIMSEIEMISPEESSREKLNKYLGEILESVGAFQRTAGRR